MHHSIDHHMIQELQMAIEHENKQRTSRKSFNSVGIKDFGAQFFSRSKVYPAKDQQAFKNLAKL